MATPFTVPPRPSAGSTPWDLEAHFAALQTRLREVESGIGHNLDSFDGADDDAKLTAALTYQAAQTYRPPIRMPNRQCTFNTANRVPFDGMRIIGPPGWNSPEKFSQTLMTHRVHLSMTGAWFSHTAGTNLFSISFKDLAITGGSNARVLTNDSTSRFTSLHMENISTNGLRSVVGTPAQALTITASMFNGYWHASNSYSTAVHVGGSDNMLFTAGGLMDSGVAFHTSGGEANGIPHLWCDYLDYSYVGGLFITCEGPWRGLKVSGPTYNTTHDNNGRSIYDSLIIQGRNSSQPCYGAVARIEGGQAIMRDCMFDFGMSDAATMGTGDLGVVHHTSGHLAIRDAQYNRIPAQAETVPFVYSTGASSRGYVRDVTVGTKSEGWTGLPRVRRVGSSALTVDSSVTLVEA